MSTAALETKDAATDAAKTVSPTTGPTSGAARHPAFSWLRSHRIDTLNLTMEAYQHKVTGALHYHLASDDPENVFLVGFRTVPMDSTGVAHILEHTVLCGSEKYPVRDPFFMMIRRSLNTFMNAMTSSDWTAYPFASKNRKDFDNLLRIYLDAVFFSRLHELDFAQEGHRLEFMDPEDSNSELMFKGVVYNEMKGAMSSPAARLWQTMTRYLFPTTTYHFNSGGEPEDIPDLDYQQLLDFYRRHYHPSNAVFMTFGDIPAVEHQQRMEELALARFEAQDTGIEVRNEKRYLAPVRVTEHYPLEEEDISDKTHVVVGWLLGPSSNLNSLFEAQLLASVLLDNSASPLLQALETTSLGKSPSPLCGLEDNNREMSFMCGLEGCQSTATEDVESLVINTLTRIAETGVSQEMIEAALHQLELGQREITGDGHPYGLQLIMAGLSTAIHHGDPIELLDVDPVLTRLRASIQDPDYLPGLIRKLILDNPHRVTLTLVPDTAMAQRQIDAEKARLDTIRRSLDEDQKSAIVAQSRALQARQETEDDDSILPKVGLEDVPPGIEIIVPERHEISVRARAADSGVQPVSFYARGTNGISYQQVIAELPQLNDELLALLPLYTACLTELGVGQRDYSEVQAWQSRISGGLNCSASIRSSMNDEQKVRAVLVLSGKALARNESALSDLILETFHDARFDEQQRIRELLEQIASRQQHGITGRGHLHAATAACAAMSPSAALNHHSGGLAGVRSLKHRVQQFDTPDRLEKVLEGFRQIHALIREAPRQFLLIGENDSTPLLAERWADKAMAGNFQALSLTPCRDTVREIWTTSTQVNFCAKAFPTVPSGHPDHAPLCVLAGFMRNTFLHRAVREQGGAYGAGADQDANAAAFRFYSYRDPRLAETLEDFDRAVDWVLERDHAWQPVEEAILGVISSQDRSTSPAGAARQAFYHELFGRTTEQRQAFRQRILNLTLKDLQEVAAKYLKNPDASIAVLSNSEKNVPDALNLKTEKL